MQQRVGQKTKQKPNMNRLQKWSIGGERLNSNQKMKYVIHILCQQRVAGMDTVQGSLQLEPNQKVFS